MTSETHLIDCMELMAKYPDGYFDLACVDPPYGINADVKNSTDKKQSKKSASNSKNYGGQKWDSYVPTEDYFKELFRVSKHQIIWGVNYYPYSFLSGGRIYWDKCVTMPTYSDGELAFCSLLNSIKSVKIAWHGMIQEDMKNKEERLHPTQKPIALYDWVFSKYAKQHICIHKHSKEYKWLCTDCKDIPNFRVLDTHLGSQSSRIAAYKAGLDFVGSELDPDYFRDGNQRFEDFKMQFEQEVGVEKVLKGQARLF